MYTFDICSLSLFDPIVATPIAHFVSLARIVLTFLACPLAAGLDPATSYLSPRAGSSRCAGAGFGAEKPEKKSSNLRES